jgi:hypothetical protein
MDFTEYIHPTSVRLFEEKRPENSWQPNLLRICSVQELFKPPGPAPDNMNANNQSCLTPA